MSSDSMRYPNEPIERLAGVVDFVVICASGPAAVLIYRSVSHVTPSVSIYFGLSLLIAGAFVAANALRGGYHVESLLRLDRQARLVAFHWTVSFGLMLGVAYLMKSTVEFSRGATTTLFNVGGLILLGARVWWSRYLRSAMARGKLRRRRAILLTYFGGSNVVDLRGQLERGGFEIVQCHAIVGLGSVNLMQGEEALIASARGTDVEEILIALPYTNLPLLPDMLQQLRATPLPVRLIPDEHLSSVLFQRKRGFGSFALIEAKREPLTGTERLAKRALDLFLAAAAIVSLAPLFAAVSIAIWLDTSGPILFRQTRRGFNGRTFKILKFRTMTVLEDGPAISQTTRGDRRVTRVGRWLRKTSIDELPQLWNVLRGDMSIVGPRPHAVAHDEYYDDLIENYAYRQHVKPGLTGWAQVNGLRGETPRVEDMKARVEHDLWYISNWSFRLDLRIILLTGTHLLSDGAY